MKWYHWSCNECDAYASADGPELSEGSKRVHIMNSGHSSIKEWIDDKIQDISKDAN